MFVERLLMAGSGESEDMLATGVVNDGYHSRRVNGSLSFQLRVDQPHGMKRFAYWLARKPLGFKSYFVVNPVFVPSRPERLEPTDNFTAYFKQSTVWEAAQEAGLLAGRPNGPVVVRTFIQDGTHRHFPSNWLTLRKS